LFHSFEKTTTTAIEGVMVAHDTSRHPDNLRGLVEKLLESARLDKEAAALMWLQRILPAFGREQSPISTYVPNSIVRRGPDLSAG
jgi:hypothetical protein